MRSSSCKWLLSTKAPATSVVDQSSSALQQSGPQSARISRLEQSGGWMNSSTVQGQSQIHQQFSGPMQQTLLLNAVRPRSFQIEFSPTSETLGGDATPKTPVLFTVNGAKSRLSSTLPYSKPQGILAPQYENDTLHGIKNMSRSNDSILRPIVSSTHRSRPSSSNLNTYPLHQNLSNIGSARDHHTPNFISTPHALNTEQGNFNADHQEVVSAMISPIYRRIDEFTQPAKEAVSTATIDNEIFSDEQHQSLQSFQVQASGKAIAFVAAQQRALHAPIVGRNPQKIKRSTSASRPQYSKPSHPAFIKEVDVALHKLQSNTIYSSTIDMLSNNELNHVYAVHPTHFKLMRKKWKASEPPSLPPPPSSDDTLPDGIPVLTANPRELKDQYITALRPVQPVPSSSIGFFIESDPHVSKKRYTLRRVSSANASFIAAQQRGNNHATDRELRQRSLKLTGSSGTEALSAADKVQNLDDFHAFQNNDLLTPDLSMQTDTVTDTITTPVKDPKNDRLTIDELEQPLLAQKQIYESEIIHGQDTCSRSNKIPSRSQSAGEHLVSQKTHHALVNKPLLNVHSLVDNKPSLRPPLSLSSRSSSSRRAYSAQPVRSGDVLLASQSGVGAHATFNIVAQKHSTINQATVFSKQLKNPVSPSTGKDTLCTSNGFITRSKLSNTTRRRPLSSGDPSHPRHVYRTIHGEKPIARGFSTQSNRLTHTSMRSTTNSTNSSLRPDVSLTPHQSVYASKALAVSAVLPTSSLALSMANSYIQSQARSKYNMALMRLQAPSVTLESVPPHQGKARATSASASASIRHSRRTIGIQPRSTTDQSISTAPLATDIDKYHYGTSSVTTKRSSYFARTRNAKIGTIELKDAYTETGSYRSGTEMSDTRSSLDHPLSPGKQKGVQIFDGTQSRRSRSGSFKKVAGKTHSAHVRSQSSSSIIALGRPNTSKTSSVKRSHSATFHSHSDNFTLAPTHDINTTDILAARRLIQLHTNPYFVDHKRDTITRHLTDIATMPLCSREARSSAEKSNQPESPNIVEMLRGLDIPTINSAESSMHHDLRALSDNRSANSSSHDPSISRNQSANGTFSSMHTLPSIELRGKDAPVCSQSNEFIQLLGTDVFPSSSATLEMYIGGLNYQEIDLQHHIFSKRSIATVSESTNEKQEVSKKRFTRKTRSGSVSGSSGITYNTKRCRSGPSSCSSSRRDPSVSNPVTQMMVHSLEPQTSLELHPSMHLHSSINADMVLEDLDIDGADPNCPSNSAVRTSNYKETVLLKRKAPDGRTQLAMVSTGDILYDSYNTKTALDLTTQQSHGSLSASAHSAPHRQHAKTRSVKKASTMFNYPSITGTFPLYVDEDEQKAEPHSTAHINNETLSPQRGYHQISQSLPPNKQSSRTKNTGSSIARYNQFLSNHKTLSVSVSAAMARRAFEKQASDRTLNTFMHQTMTPNTSGLQSSPTTSFSRDVSHISQRQSLDKEPIAVKEQNKDTLHQSPMIFTSLADTSPLLPSNPTTTVKETADPDNQSILRSSQPLPKNHVILDNPRKESAHRARSNRLTETEKDMRASVLSNTQRSSTTERSYRETSGKRSSYVKQYSRSYVRPASSSSLSGSMTTRQANRCQSSCAVRSVSSAKKLPQRIT
ncbi:hemagglutinin protein-like protein [Giardia lamblia P15]|uniref:Hemagglutinin protein-like protein n=1 Tax=Giardia intestinalis (strain P15) TaxID=658858 RepID=E1EWC7_GIAIA|nr:hemagglutinin protein-like protein [Giardia lamblia P15]